MALGQFTLRPNGESYWAHCTLCRHKEGGHGLDGTAKQRESRPFSLDPQLPLLLLTDFLNYLTAQNSDLDLETRLSISTLSPSLSDKDKAEDLKNMINEVMPYRFMYVFLCLNWWENFLTITLAIVTPALLPGVYRSAIIVLRMLDVKRNHVKLHLRASNGTRFPWISFLAKATSPSYLLNQVLVRATFIQFALVCLSIFHSNLL